MRLVLNSALVTSINKESLDNSRIFTIVIHVAVLRVPARRLFRGSALDVSDFHDVTRLVVGNTLWLCALNIIVRDTVSHELGWCDGAHLDL